MRNFGRRARVKTATVAIWLLVSAAAEAQTARSRYESAAERETNVRVLLTNHTAATAPAGAAPSADPRRTTAPSSPR